MIKGKVTISKHSDNNDIVLRDYTENIIANFSVDSQYTKKEDLEHAEMVAKILNNYEDLRKALVALKGICSFVPAERVFKDGAAEDFKKLLANATLVLRQC
jgi:hypothetical protein